MSFKKIASNSNRPSFAKTEAPSRLSFKGSEQQEAIWHTIAKESCNLIVKAGAGCGKTTTIVESLFRLEKGTKACFCAFNKSIASELRSRVPYGTPALTLHSLGNAIVCAATDSKPVLDQFKTDKILRRLVNTVSIGDSIGISKLVSLCKANLLNGEDPAQLKVLIQAFDIEIRDKQLAYDTVPAILNTAAEITEIIDYDDMLWLPVVNKLEGQRYDLLLVDESQDLNHCQQTLALQVADRFVFVGDPKQAIYAFRGADAEAMDNLEDRLHASDLGCKVLPLSITRRCPKQHVALVAPLVSDFQAAPEAPEGIIRTVSTLAAMDEYQAGDFILCRTNAPLLSTAFSLIKRGKRVRIQGRDLGKTLLSLVKRFKPDTIETLLYKLGDYEDREEGRILAETKYPENRLEALRDKCNCLRAICDGCETIDEVTNQIATLFTEAQEEGKDSEEILLSSAHRGKGLEAKRVFVLKPELLPHPMAKKPADREQELNILYVICTRSKEELIFVGAIPNVLRRPSK